MNQYTPVETDYFIPNELRSGLITPSAIHGYSLAVEYYRDWLISKFDKGYFKTIFINGRHILQDYMRYSEVSMIKQAKPAIAITPKANLEYNRDGIDKYLGGRNALISNFNHKQCWFKDYDNNIFVGMCSRELEMEFSSRIRIETRAQQVDLIRNMELDCKVGLSNTELISADFHIPTQIINNIARSAGFEMDNNEEVLDKNQFLSYLRNCSIFPITYKLRSITGRSEYFIRVDNVLAQILNTNDLSYDDGEQQGQLFNNFHVEMESTLHMSVPSYYVIYTAKPLYRFMRLENESIFGLYTTHLLDMPNMNEKYWKLFTKTGFDMSLEAYKSKEVEIDISSLFYNTNLKNVVDYHLKQGLSPSIFIDIKLYDYDIRTNYIIDWNSMHIKCKDFTSKELYIGVYIDMDYYSDILDTINNINKTNYNKEK